MLSPSLRQAAARSCPRGQTLPSLAATATRASTPLAAAAPFPSRGHQRRQSSSKPPVPPNNGSPTIPASAVKQVGASRSESKKPVSESRVSKRKAQRTDPREQVRAEDNWTATLPSVPSTQHLNQKDVNISVFYATYRPISITGPGPREVKMDEIDKLFEPKPKWSSKLRTPQNEVIYTLSSMIENLNEQVEQRQASHESQTVAQKADLIKQIVQNNEHSKPISIESHGSKQMVKLDMQKLTHHFRPFNVPPPPTPVSQAELDLLDAEESAAEAAAEANDEMLAQELEGHSLRAQLAAHEQDNQPAQVAQVYFNGQVGGEAEVETSTFFTSHMQIEPNPRLIRGIKIQDPQRTYRVGSGRRRRGIRLPSTRHGGESMRLISVKRQRKLKMKKHKHKKLMRKTRNLRRRLGNL